MDAWKKLYEHVRFLSEAVQYRGQSDVRLVDLQKLGDVIGVHMDPEGGMARAQHEFNPSIWKGWYAQPGSALAVASTDTKRTIQTGNPQGGTVHKTNWGGRVANVSAPIRPHHNDRLGSTMDRYDVLMIGDIIDPRKGVLTKIAWSPSIGSAEERSQRLQALISGGQAPALKRRPQPEVPDGAPPSTVPSPQPVPRIGQNVRTRKGED